MSPSRIARYFFHECDRFLRYSAARGPQRKADGIPAVEVDRSLITRAVLESGYAWEEHLVERVLGPRVAVAAGSGPVRDRHHSAADTLAFLAGAKPGDVIYQPTLQPPPGFSAAYGLDSAVVEFLECRPDLLMVFDGDDGPEVRVVDAKASDEMKLSHRIQVALYTVLLEHVLVGAGLDDRLRVSRLGGVWLYHQPEVEWFDLSKVRAPLETFLAHGLMPVLQAPPGEAFWHLYFRCEWCDYFTHCRAEAEKTRDVSLVPYLSTFAKRHLAEVAAVRTIDDLARVLDRPDAADLLRGCASLEGRRERLRQAVDSVRTGTSRPTGAASVSMPKGENVRLVLTLQSEPVTGALYAYGLSRVNRKGRVSELDQPYREIVRVAVDDRPETLAQLRRDLIGDLIAVLGAVDRFNRGTPEWREQLSVQVFTFDSYERGLLVQALLDEITDGGALVDQALSLLFWFQHPELVEAEDHPSGEVAFPVVVVTEVLRQVMALPVPVVYRLAEVSRALVPAQHSWVHRHDDYHDFVFSNRMKSNAIFEVWRRGRSDLIPNIERHLRSRVRACESIIRGLRERLDATNALFAWPPKLFLPPGLGFTHPTLSRLSFIARYESVLACLESRKRRTRTPDELLSQAGTYRIRWVNGEWWEAEDGQDLARLDRSDFPSWILTVDDPTGNRARLAYDDLLYRRAAWPPKDRALALATVMEIDAEHRRLKLSLSPSTGFTMPGRDQWCWLDSRQTDYTTERLLGELAALDAERHPWFVGVVDDPVGVRALMVNPPRVAETARRLARQHGMTPSQLAAFDGVIDHDLQAVWGPPGTGKTHWLALAVLCLAEAHRDAGLPLRVLITSFTHAAIDNCLRKIENLQSDRRVVRGDLVVKKIDKGTDEAFDLARPPAPPLAVYGSTVWQVARVPADRNRFDLVVIDEGSQLECGDSAIAVRRVASNGRLVVCGDDDQLPPIVAGDYPALDGAPPLHRSILEVLRHADPRGEHGLVLPLLENFRMNDRLCEYPRRSIYPPACAAPW